MFTRKLIYSIFFSLVVAGMAAANDNGAISSTATIAKKRAHGSSAKASIQMPAQGLIADALLDPQFLGSHDPYSSGTAYTIDGAWERRRCQWQGETEVNGNGTLSDFALGNSGSEPEGTPKKDAQSYLLPVAIVTSAYAGWQVNVIGGFGEEKATPDEIKNYLVCQEASVEYTNALFTQIAASLNNDVGVLKNPHTAKLAIQKIFLAIPKPTLIELWKDVVRRAQQHSGRTLNLSGTKGVDWMAGGGSYSGNPDGLTWTKSGVKWFGQGALSGKQWTIGLESSINNSTEQGSSGTENNSGSTGR